MRPNMTLRAPGPTVYVDARPLFDKYLTGIGRYTARIYLPSPLEVPEFDFSQAIENCSRRAGSTGRRTKTWAVGAPG